MLGGELTLFSIAGKGSTFNLYLPLDVDVPDSDVKQKYIPEVIDVTPLKRNRNYQNNIEELIIDDRDDIQPGDRVFVIIEDDQKFNEILLDVLHKKGSKRSSLIKAQMYWSLLISISQSLLLSICI